MIFCKELGKEFTDKAEMFLALKKSVKEIIGLKKAAIKNSEPTLAQLRDNDAIKAMPGDYQFKVGDTIYPVINTTNYLDSHGDVHLDGIWDLSLKDNQGKVYYTTEHDLRMKSLVSYPNEVSMQVKTMPWTSLGKSYTGNTQALIFSAKTSTKSNPHFLEALKDGQPLENSVRMQYVDIALAVNSNDKELADEKKNWDKHYSVIANKSVADESGYFWAVSQAKISKEGSAVLAGSNDATPILYTNPADAGLEHKESPASTSFDLNKLLNIF